MTVPKRRWPRFSLRTMFVVVTVACVLLSWIIPNVIQVRERERLLGSAGVLKVGEFSKAPPARGYTREIPAESFLPGSPMPSYKYLPRSDPVSKRVPVLWSLLGAKPTDYLMIDRYRWSQSDFQYIRETFPEATIYYVYVGNLDSVQFGKDGRASGMQIHAVPREQWPATWKE